MYMCSDQTWIPEIMAGTTKLTKWSWVVLVTLTTLSYHAALAQRTTIDLAALRRAVSSASDLGQLLSKAQFRFCLSLNFRAILTSSENQKSKQRSVESLGRKAAAVADPASDDLFLSFVLRFKWTST